MAQLSQLHILRWKSHGMSWEYRGHWWKYKPTQGSIWARLDRMGDAASNNLTVCLKMGYGHFTTKIMINHGMLSDAPAFTHRKHSPVSHTFNDKPGNEKPTIHSWFAHEKTSICRVFSIVMFDDRRVWPMMSWHWDCPFLGSYRDTFRALDQFVSTHKAAPGAVATEMMETSSSTKNMKTSTKQQNIR